MGEESLDQSDRSDRSNQSVPEVELPRRLSAKACGPGGSALTEDELDAAEQEAEEWARRVNSC